MKETIRIWFCMVNGKKVYRSFRAFESRTFARSFNRVANGRARCSVTSQLFTAEDAAPVLQRSPVAPVHEKRCKLPSSPSGSDLAIAGKPAPQAVRKPR